MHVLCGAEDDLGDFVVDGGHRAGRHRSEAFDAYGADELADIFGDEPVYDFEVCAACIWQSGAFL
jgi:hypothetical protein